MKTALQELIEILNKEIDFYCGDSDYNKGVRLGLVIGITVAEQILEKEWIKCVNKAKKIIKKGDKIRLTHCPGTKRTIIFDHWDGNWIVSKSGNNEYSAMSIDMINGNKISFSN